MAGRPPPLLRIAQATFYRHHPSAVPATAVGKGATTESGDIHHHHLPNPPFFKGLDFTLPANPVAAAAAGAGAGASPEMAAAAERWCVVGPSLSGKTTFLQVLRGEHVSEPARARSYPWLATEEVPTRLRSAGRALRYVGFEDMGLTNTTTTSAYLAARYESRREVTDFSLRDYLLGNTQLNAAAETQTVTEADEQLLQRVVRDLKLDPLLDLPVSFLSNGQGRRARIAQALLTRPLALLLDEPFMGLDPPTVASLSPLLQSLATAADPQVVLSSRPQDPLPAWISRLVYLRTDGQVAAMGSTEEVLAELRNYYRAVRRGTQSEDPGLPVHALGEMGRVQTESGIEGEEFEGGEVGRGVTLGEKVEKTKESEASAEEKKAEDKKKEPLVELLGCRVQYGDRVVLGNWTNPGSDGKDQKDQKDGLVWTVRRGDRWGVFGPNGSGKTTLVSLLCSDHPQTYAQPLRLFGRSRLPEKGQPGLTYWDIQARIGHSSPEVHQHMPRGLTARQVVASAWADTFRSKPKLTAQDEKTIDQTLDRFQHELGLLSSSSSSSPSSKEEALFGELSFSAQRVLLLLRAAVKKPDIVVLDEAFSGMDEAVRDKCAAFLEKSLGPEQALICIAHVKEEVPDCVREWVCLPEANLGTPARFGRLDGPLRTDRRRWDEIWGVKGE